MILIPFLVVGVLVLAVWGYVRSVTGRPVRGNAEEETDEARLMQELHHGMARLEDRVENLETIVLEREHPKSDTHGE
ncbi:MAG: hypothetical protein R6V12_11350 [Candidatus Hydrogenedentota bacterium]